MPIPRRNLYAVNAANRPWMLPPAPYEPAPSAAKTIRMTVEIINDHFLE